MPALDFEVEEALEEGVLVKWLSTIKQAGDGELTIEKMVLDEKGNPQPTGELETLKADSLVLALGQDVDLSLLDGVPGLMVRDGVVQVDPATMMTGHPGLFAGGDMVPAERNVTVAIGHGKKAARHIDAWLRGTRIAPAPKHAPATFERLNTWYYSDAPKTVRPQLDIARRTSSFDEVQGGLTEDNALFEARRCLSCGNCFECDNCYGVCPDNAVVKLGPGKGFEFNYDYCKGCGVCVAECPSRRDRDGAGGRLARRQAARAGLDGRVFEQVLQADRIGDLDLALAHEQQPVGLELRERPAHRLELEPEKAADLLAAHAQQQRRCRKAARVQAIASG